MVSVTSEGADVDPEGSVPFCAKKVDTATERARSGIHEFDLAEKGHPEFGACSVRCFSPTVTLNPDGTPNPAAVRQTETHSRTAGAGEPGKPPVRYPERLGVKSQSLRPDISRLNPTAHLVGAGEEIPHARTG
ncbi:hypothetical protein GCM10010298_24180 [Streptomyces microflavus]|uniref:Uncharacterized protein n=1 Tax=Streptomyces microflavus TaxID=1919 RepID=A0A7J0D2X5_STRMI|nr:hypothetical protein Smic_76260 [Streptomyces microflavus]GGX58714.1 hypothetical protein GCM10010298_24180 [Streptomyces microflavus]